MEHIFGDGAVSPVIGLILATGPPTGNLRRYSHTSLPAPPPPRPNARAGRHGRRSSPYNALAALPLAGAGSADMLPYTSSPPHTPRHLRLPWHSGYYVVCFCLALCRGGCRVLAHSLPQLVLLRKLLVAKRQRPWCSSFNSTSSRQCERLP